MAPVENEIEALLDTLAAGLATPASQLTILSDLDRDCIQQLRQGWQRLPPSSKASLLVESTELADDNVDLDFTQLARVALADEAAEVRVLAVEALWESTDRHVARDLTRLLREDPDESVRAAAATSLRQFVLLRELEEFNAAQGDEIVEALRAAAGEAESSLEVRARALEALGLRGLPWVRELISSAYYDDDRGMRLAAVVAMGGTANDEWLEYLFEQLHSEDPEFRFQAAASLGMIASEEAVDPLVETLDDEDSEVQLAAVTALGEIGGARALRHLRDFRSRTPPGFEESIDFAIEAAAVASEPPTVDDEGEDDSL